MLNIKDTIMQKLRETEECYQVKIVLAIESGSRGWGLAANDADYDCRFVYVHSRDWYLSVMDNADYIECASDTVFDINGWDLKKFLKHIMKSNVVTSEWLSSNEVYIKDEAIVKLLQGLAAKFFNPIAERRLTFIQTCHAPYAAVNYGCRHITRQWHNNQKNARTFTSNGYT